MKYFDLKKQPSNVFIVIMPLVMAAIVSAIALGVLHAVQNNDYFYIVTSIIFTAIITPVTLYTHNRVRKLDVWK